MATSVLINNLTLCHKGDGVGTVTATMPDVCKTPPNAIPVPYPNIAFATDLTGGTTTVLVDGGHMAAHSASVFAKSIGDEPGTLGGVKSGVNRAEASWISYSMDVFFEGLNVCRLTDKMLLNHGNTVSMGGFLTTWLKAWVAAAKNGVLDCEELAKKIDEILNGNKDQGTSPADGMRGVKERYWQQVEGKIKPGEPGWDTHEKALQDMQEQLRDYLNAFTQWCNGGTPVPIPEDAWKWANKPAPAVHDYTGPLTANVPSNSWMPDWSTIVGGGVLAIVVVGGIILAPEVTLPALAFAL